LALRSNLDEILEQVKLKLGSQITHLVSALETEARAGEGAVRPSLKVARAMARQLREIRLKPKKGRVKDLVRAHDLLENLVELLPPQA
jgi:hypothetical protein